MAGHVLRMAPERPGYQSIAEKEEAGPGRPGGQHFVTTYMQGVGWSEAEELAADRVHWQNLLPIVLTRDQRN